ncbi:hypothetical protein HD806DRAFT_491850 [Xylariaceae sp. AK1471]|nr:hypothetical protein HD806DRAFT_491850 [Xylariaceae sp. AK1471]
MPYGLVLPSGTTSFTANTSYIAVNCLTFAKTTTDNTYTLTNFTEASTTPLLQIKNNSWYSSTMKLSFGDGEDFIIPSGFQVALSVCMNGCDGYSTPEEIQEPMEACRIV